MTTIRVKRGSKWENIALTSYPVGSVYISYVNTSPAVLFGGTWSQITTGVLRMANNTNTGGSDTFTITSANLPKHTHSVGAHSHGLNGHTHSVGAHSHGLNSHKHSYAKVDTPTGSTTLTIEQIPPHDHLKSIRADWGTPNGDDSGITVDDGRAIDGYFSKNGNTGGGKGHTHTISTTSTNSGAASGSTADSAAFNTGGNSGNTANSTAFNTSDGGFSNTAISNLPAYQNLYAWRRTA